MTHILNNFRARLLRPFNGFGRAVVFPNFQSGFSTLALTLVTSGVITTTVAIMHDSAAKKEQQLYREQVKDVLGGSNHNAITKLDQYLTAGYLVGNAASHQSAPQLIVAPTAPAPLKARYLATSSGNQTFLSVSCNPRAFRGDKAEHLYGSGAQFPSAATANCQPIETRVRYVAADWTKRWIDVVATTSVIRNTGKKPTASDIFAETTRARVQVPNVQTPPPSPSVGPTVVNVDIDCQGLATPNVISGTSPSGRVAVNVRGRICPKADRNATVVFIVDQSASTGVDDSGNNDGTDPQQAGSCGRLRAIQTVVSQMKRDRQEGDKLQIGAVTFASRAMFYTKPMSVEAFQNWADTDHICRFSIGNQAQMSRQGALDAIREFGFPNDSSFYGSTNYPAAFAAANTLLSGVTSGKKLIYFMTDGEPMMPLSQTDLQALWQNFLQNQKHLTEDQVKAMSAEQQKRLNQEFTPIARALQRKQLFEPSIIAGKGLIAATGATMYALILGNIPNARAVLHAITSADLVREAATAGSLAEEIMKFKEPVLDASSVAGSLTSPYTVPLKLTNVRKVEDDSSAKKPPGSPLSAKNPPVWLYETQFQILPANQPTTYRIQVSGQVASGEQASIAATIVYKP